MDPSQAHSSRKVYTLSLQSHRKLESDLPPHPLAKLLLAVEIRTQEQGLTDHPAMRREFSITGLLKSEFIDLPTDHIQAYHISFDSFCRRVEKASNIKFDAARDELGWVQEPKRPDEKQQYWGIFSELTFQNALGMMRLSTTQSKPPQVLILHLWSPAPKEPIFRRSRRAPIPKGFLVGEGSKSEANSQNPPGSSTPPLIGPVLNGSANEANSQTSPGSSMPPFIGPVLNGSANEASTQKPSGSSTPPFIDRDLNQFGGADADVEMTISAPPTFFHDVALRISQSGSSRGYKIMRTAIQWHLERR